MTDGRNEEGEDADMGDTHHSKPKSDENDSKIAREMLPFFIHIIWPILLIVFIWKTFAPTNF